MEKNTRKEFISFITVFISVSIAVIYLIIVFILDSRSMIHPSLDALG